jgi:hypothetical protein
MPSAVHERRHARLSRRFQYPRSIESAPAAAQRGGRCQCDDQHDIDFLTGFANVLAEAVATSVRTVAASPDWGV